MSWRSFTFLRPGPARDFQRCLSRTFCRQWPVEFGLDENTVRCQRIWRSDAGYAMTKMQFANLKAKLHWFEKGWRSGRGIS